MNDLRVVSLLSYRTAIVGITALGMILPFAPLKRSLYWSFLIWIALFFLGYRTIGITTNLSLHPLVVVMLAIFVALFVSAAHSQRPLDWHPPRLLLVFSIFWVWGVARALASQIPLDLILGQVSNFIMIFPLWIVATRVLSERSRWQGVVSVFFAVGTAIAVLGVLEYFCPAISAFFPLYMAPRRIADAVSISGTASFFERGMFSFWGHPVASFLCALALPFAIPLWAWHDRFPARLTVAGAVVVQLLGIYISGYRSVWVLVATLAVVALLLRGRLIEMLLAGVALVVMVLLIPREGQFRLESVGHFMLGEWTDTSSAQRLTRAGVAVQQMMAHPLGRGWGSSGWVHSDVLQLGADLGVLAAGVFALWYGATLAALGRRQRQARDPLTLGLLASFLVLGGLLLTQAVYVLPQLIMPGWLVWAMADLRARHQGPQTPAIIGQ